MTGGVPSLLRSIIARVDAPGEEPGAKTEASARDAAPDTAAASGADHVATGTSDILGGVAKAILVCVGLFTLWGATFPLSSSVVAGGTLISEGYNQLVQHPSGGIVVEILARNGDRVEAGDVIARLDPAPVRADLTRLKARRATLIAIDERLRAELRGDADAPLAIRGTDGEETQAVLASSSLADELRLEQSRARREGEVSLKASLEAIDRQSAATEAQSEGLDQRIEGLESQIAIYADQAERVRRLADAGHIARREVWQSEDQLIDARSRLSGLVAERGMAQERLGELVAERRRLVGETAREDAEQLTEVIGELGQIEDQITAAERALELGRLTAPVSGTLVNSHLTTTGGVARGGETLAEIVRDDDRMMFEARLLPKDIDHVRVGQPAKIELTAFNTRLVDRLRGTVAYVSADTTEDERTGEHFYTARIEIEPGSAPETLRSGMAGTAFISGPSRTFFVYLFQPLIDGYRHAFQELK
ncbi:HlyD family type I secretion periplasmic adaptor subunit [Fulvimarina endophytica]|uniref:Membrane fusion protein (MFP) family protein n=1 Tax=Fulvimarina endophytica TaxID=2293836 RepID=A0A371X4H9_9HYPH|nr:HlyD family type I secretion periplasmic adaptor subunit [Fulvimarina endophytica]RFC64142.1 HlyD family type I secretion periplasmic adaptor subunit [Fulvimarina endophytica]